MRRETIFSPCRRYRYTLWREWSDLWRNESYVQFIGLNPSTADETQDDPTIRRCIDFAKRWGFGALCMTNAFAWRDTDPTAMMAAESPVSPPGTLSNDGWIKTIADGAGLVVAAWGKHGRYQNRDQKIIQFLRERGIQLYCLRQNDDGTPEHPLYIPATTKPQPYPIPA